MWYIDNPLMTGIAIDLKSLIKRINVTWEFINWDVVSSHNQFWGRMKSSTQLIRICIYFYNCISTTVLICLHLLPDSAFERGPWVTNEENHKLLR